MAPRRGAIAELVEAALHFARLVSRDDVDALRGELAELRARIDGARGALDRLERSRLTSPPSSRGPGTP